MTLKKKPFENIVGKGENASNHKNLYWAKLKAFADQFQ